LGEGANEVPQPVGFIAEIETVSMLMKYEKIFYSFMEFSGSSVEYLEQELGVPYPLSYVIFILGVVCSLYISSLISKVRFSLTLDVLPKEEKGCPCVQQH
jgi:hypothetical protein